MKSRMETFWYRMTQVHVRKIAVKTQRERERERERQTDRLIVLTDTS